MIKTAFLIMTRETWGRNNHIAQSELRCLSCPLLRHIFEKGEPLGSPSIAHAYVKVLDFTTL